MIKVLVFVISLTFGILSPRSLEAHARFKINGTTPPMNNSAGIKDRDAPCGSLTNTTRTKMTANTQFTLQWEEAINHTGWFEIYFSETGPCDVVNRDFSNSASIDCWQPILKIVDNQNGANTPHQFSASIMVPNVNCTSCIFQIRQVMGGDVNNLYYSCARVEIGGSSKPTTTIDDPKCKLPE